MYELNLANPDTVLAALEASHPLCAAALWGDVNDSPHRYAMPSYYMGDDCRGWVSLMSYTYRMGVDTVTEANWRDWQKLLTALDPAKEFWGIGDFGSSMTPFQLLAVRHDAPYLDRVERELKDLDGYPIMNDDTHSAVEEEAAKRSWDMYTVRERAELLRDNGITLELNENRVNLFSARAEYPPYLDDGYYYVNPDSSY